MHRLITAGALATACVALAACSVPFLGSSAATTGASPSPGGGPGRNGASGELVKIDGTTLVVNSQAGDVTVLYDSSTAFQKTSTAALADIAVGKCITAPATKDSSGALTAGNVQLRSKNAAGTCQGGGPGGGGGGFGGPGADATPRPTPRPSPSIDPNVAFVAGEVTAVSGVNITVKTAAGASESVTVPTTVTVTRSDAAAATDLALHQCINANGQRDAAGKVTARNISIVPPGPSGCATGGGGRNFGGGGGGRGNGGGGGGNGGPPPGGPPGD